MNNTDITAKSRGAFIFIVACICMFHIISNFIWLKMDDDLFGTDVLLHLINQQNFYERFIAIFQTHDGFGEKAYSLARLFNVNLMDGFFPVYNWPRFVYFTTTLYDLFFGSSIFASRFSISIYLPILLFSIYLIGEKCGNAKSGLLAAFIGSMYPGIWGLSRQYGLDFPLTAIVALAVVFYLYTDTFRNRRYSLMFGIISGVGILIKGQFLLFIIPLLAYAFFTLLRKRADYIEEAQKNNFTNLFVAVFFTGAISAAWWWEGGSKLLKFFYDYMLLFYNCRQNIQQPDWAVGVESSYIKIFTSAWWFFYTNKTFVLISPFLSIIFLIALYYFFKSNSISNRFLLILWIFIPYIIFTIIAVKLPRFILPCYPAIAVITSLGLNELKNKVLKIILISSVIIFCFFNFFAASFFNKISDLNITSMNPASEYRWYGYYSRTPIKNNYEKVVNALIAEIVKDSGDDASIFIFERSAWWQAWNFSKLIEFKIKSHNAGINLFKSSDKEDFLKHLARCKYFIIFSLPGEDAQDIFFHIKQSSKFCALNVEKLNSSIDSKRLKMIYKNMLLPIRINIYLYKRYE